MILTCPSRRRVHAWPSCLVEAVWLRCAGSHWTARKKISHGRKTIIYGGFTCKRRASNFLLAHEYDRRFFSLMKSNRSTGLTRATLSSRTHSRTQIERVYYSAGVCSLTRAKESFVLHIFSLNTHMMRMQIAHGLSVLPESSICVSPALTF